MGMFDELKDKATDFVKENPDKVEGISDTVLDKAAGLADSATGGKYTEQIESAQTKADDAIGN